MPWSGFGKSIVNSLLTGLGFAAAMFVMAAVREILGSGDFAGHGIAFFKTYNIPAALQPHGGFVVFAILLAAIQALGGGKTSGKGHCLRRGGLSGDTVKEGGMSHESSASDNAWRRSRQQLRA